MLPEYNKILVAIDGSDESEQAFKKAIQVAKRNNAILYIAHIIDIRAFESVSSFDENLAEEATRVARDTLNNYLDYGKEHGVDDIQTIIEYGAPKTVISKQLQKEHNIDLIMLGATGLNAMERILIGSVSSYVARHAECDVLIVRTDLNNELPTKEK
ncbi:universal stress protein [Vagococcus fluvialis]|uniref:Universal stress protein n=1 Tax=Vagococcus fluvialis TaxID=2738 RepID=A0A369AN69_9ENTE|nr:universal stress protein [Vagococcus fluvialis]MBO0478481.1 universal stress protein [Vagococcus fluvialis]MBO0484643.1 universal stress protein [Vagococcus fluvialis]MDT2746474.1 universal stress protein [Vagococcus fluvialis]RCX09637.1 nucleotide-binding universal stress UspA family protein [Vagococcus fluvialis]RST98470.1 universal stress protein UspA [Vagococcus fluvialis]